MADFNADGKLDLVLTSNSNVFDGCDEYGECYDHYEAYASVHGTGGPGNLPKIAVVVLSAGPNRTIETSAEQQFDAFTTSGDDIVFRIK